MERFEKTKEFQFIGPLAVPIARFLEDMRLTGRLYNSEGGYLKRIAELAAEMDILEGHLTRELVEKWTAKRECESRQTWLHRVVVIRLLAKHMQVHAMEAYVTPLVIPRIQTDFVPHIYSEEELARLFKAADAIPFYPNCPNRREVTSLFFRMLYGCGLRLSEALRLNMRDVDIENGVITILNSKLEKSRYVPMSPELTKRCREYTSRIRVGAALDDPFFQAPSMKHYSKRGMESIFRQVLYNAGIPNTGRGPRIHDLRHTFAVHCLKKWVSLEKDINAKLPVLSAYLGHKDMKGTQDYLRMTADMYPNITTTIEQCFGSIVPEKGGFNEEG